MNFKIKAWMKFFKEHKIAKTIFLVLSIGALIYLMIKGAIISPDTNAYLKTRIKTTAGYATFLKIIHLLFERDNFWPVLMIQYTLVISAIYCFLKGVLLRLKLQPFQNWILIGILFIPIFQGNLAVINNINTSAISYALYLYFIMLMFHHVVNGKRTAYIYAIGILFILILFRSQFNFAVLGLLFFEIIQWIKNKRLNWKKIAVVILMMISVGLVDKGYHKWIHKDFFNTPFTWVSLNTSMLFVADKEDANLIDDEHAQAYFHMVKSELDHEKLLFTDNMYGNDLELNYSKYHYYLPVICNQIIHTKGVQFFRDKLQVNDIKASLALEQTNKKLFFKLLPNNIGNWFLLGLHSFLYGIGGIGIAVIFLVLWLSLLIRYKIDQIGVLYFLFIILSFFLLNRLIVAFSVHSISRYFFYNYWVPVAILFVLLNKIQKNRTIV